MPQSTALPSNADAVVIGGGIAGAASAYYLAKRGLRVVLLEKGRIAGEQSSRNWGFVRQQGRAFEELPLMMDCNAMWQNLEAELGADLGWHQGGNIYVAWKDSQMAGFEAWANGAKGFGLESHLLDPAGLAKLLPGLALKTYGGMVTPSDGQADPSKVAPAFAAAAQKHGAVISELTAVLEIETQAGAIAGVVSEVGAIKTSRLVLAGGAWSTRLLAKLGHRLPQLWLQNDVQLLAPVRPITRAGVWMPAAFRQRADGRVNIASGNDGSHPLAPHSFKFARDFWPAFMAERDKLRISFTKEAADAWLGRLADPRSHRTFDPKPDLKLLARVRADFAHAFPDLGPLTVEKSWAGYVDVTPDMLPVLEALNNPRGLVVATGLSGHGFGMGPIVGRLMAELLSGNRPSHDLAPFRLARFSDGTAKPHVHV